MARLEQQHISSVLGEIDDLIFLRKQQLAKLDELIKARFVEMFGDMLLNPLAWPESSLDSMADIVSGITKGRKTQNTELIEVPYMAVSNVKDGYIDWTTVKTIMATKAEIDQYRIQTNDIKSTLFPAQRNCEKMPQNKKTICGMTSCAATRFASNGKK